MENRVARRFVEQVNELITKSEDRDAIFQALETYQSTLDLVQLVEEMMKYIDEPMKLEIYEYLRPLIPPKHQAEYDKLAPPPAGQKLRVINLRRRQNESLGFAVRGGFEHGIGVFVSQVTSGSQANLQGLKVGDEIVRVNGFTIAEAIHEEVLNLIKSYDEIELKVTNIGMLPIKDKADDEVTWTYVERSAINRRSKYDGKKFHNQPDKEGEEVKVFINLRTAPSLGCSIISGPRHFPGIYVEVVKQNSLAEKVGMEAGDQILKVNDTSFIDTTHNEAVVALKSSKELSVLLRKHVGIPLIQAGSSNISRQNSKASAPSSPPVQDNNRFAANDSYLHTDELSSSITQKSEDNHFSMSVIVSSYSLRSREERISESKYNINEKEEEDIIQIVDIVEPEVSIYREPSDHEEEEEDTAERLQKLLQEKLKQKKKEAEVLRMETFEENRQKRQSLEKELLRKIQKNRKEAEEDLRLCRHKQEEEEMLRESPGELNGFVKTFAKLWQPRSLFKKIKKEDDILSGRGGPLKKSNLGLLGEPSKHSQGPGINEDVDIISMMNKDVNIDSPIFNTTGDDTIELDQQLYSVVTYVSAENSK